MVAARQFGAKSEARRAVRRIVDLECDVYCELWGEAIAHRATDVSEDGLWIQTELLLEVGTEVSLTFHPPDWDEPLYVAGRVQRVDLQPRPGAGRAVGMGIEFQALRTDERRRLTQSMRCLRAQESFILGQRTLTGVPVGAGDVLDRASPSPAGTVVGWSAPTPAARHPGPAARLTATHAAPDTSIEPPEVVFRGGLDLATWLFAPRQPG
jgi:Tfp pilus assembly protein PilZ